MERKSEASRYGAVREPEKPKQRSPGLESAEGFQEHHRNPSDQIWVLSHFPGPDEPSNPMMNEPSIRAWVRHRSSHDASLFMFPLTSYFHIYIFPTFSSQLVPRSIREPVILQTSSILPSNSLRTHHILPLRLGIWETLMAQWTLVLFLHSYKLNLSFHFPEPSSLPVNKQNNPAPPVLLHDVLKCYKDKPIMPLVDVNMLEKYDYWQRILRQQTCLRQFFTRSLRK